MTKILCYLLACSCFISVAFAKNVQKDSAKTSVSSSAKDWKIIEKSSSINFTATQNGSSVNGGFLKFDGKISFDPSKLQASKVNITIDINSITASYANVIATLKGLDWFDVKMFPNAVYTADKFEKLTDKTYKAQGTLTIKGKSVKTPLNFEFIEYSDKKAVVHGTTTIKRNDFGIGLGDWSKTDSVKDEVKINFIIVAE